MSGESQQQAASVFRIDVSPEPRQAAGEDKLAVILNEILKQQEAQSKLLSEISENLAATQRQRANELGQWKQAHPELSSACREAAETLSRVQTQFLRNITEEIMDQEEVLVDGEFMLNEFVDRFGPRLAHLNGVLQVLTQLSSVTAANNG